MLRHCHLGYFTDIRNVGKNQQLRDVSTFRSDQKAVLATGYRAVCNINDYVQQNLDIDTD